MIDYVEIINAIGKNIKEIISISDLSFSDLITAIAGTVLAIAGILALTTWKKQYKTDRNIKFLDELTDNVYTYTGLMLAPIQKLRSIEIGIKVREKTKYEDPNERLYRAFIDYAKEWGERERDRLLEKLDNIRPLGNKIASLATKGQLFFFKDYKKCIEILEYLIWPMNQLDAYAGQFDILNLNVENQEVREITLDIIKKVNSQDLLKNLNQKHTEYLNYIKFVYQAQL